MVWSRTLSASFPAGRGFETFRDTDVVVSYVYLYKPYIHMCIYICIMHIAYHIYIYVLICVDLYIERERKKKSVRVE